MSDQQQVPTDQWPQWFSYIRANARQNMRTGVTDFVPLFGIHFAVPEKHALQAETSIDQIKHWLWGFIQRDFVHRAVLADAEKRLAVAEAREKALREALVVADQELDRLSFIICEEDQESVSCVRANIEAALTAAKEGGNGE